MIDPIAQARARFLAQIETASQQLEAELQRDAITRAVWQEAQDALRRRLDAVLAARLDELPASARQARTEIHAIRRIVAS